jgi:hypothetical protein
MFAPFLISSTISLGIQPCVVVVVVFFFFNEGNA